MERSRISGKAQLRYPTQSQEEADEEFASDIAMRKAIINESKLSACICVCACCVPPYSPTHPSTSLPLSLSHTHPPGHTLLLPEMRLTKLPLGMGDTIFLQLSFLTNVSMPHNKIQSILNTDLPQLSLYHLRYIQNINLSGNMITTLPPDFGSLVHLETLDLSFNQMSSLPGSMSRLKKLHTLNFQNNNFTTLTDELALLDSCTYLDLSQNLLVAIPSPVVRMLNLKTLLLNRNSISHCAVQPRFVFFCL